MKISSQKIINLPVETVGGHQLGWVESFVVDIDSQSILEYIVKSSNLVQKIVTNKLVISRGQVVDINEEKLIVDDLVIGEKEKTKKKIAKQKIAQGAAMKEIED
ncbi:MAG TPA: PRC-barrel domain-containing protein [bacterium]|nr:PRC-barrel domain-containing protein [bacterium]